jgi:hypothetical protein
MLETTKTCLTEDYQLTHAPTKHRNSRDHLDMIFLASPRIKSLHSPSLIEHHLVTLRSALLFPQAHEKREQLHDRASPSLTWRSMRPRYSSDPSPLSLARSPVRYARW